MKKYIFILVIGLGIFFLPHFSLADSLSNYVNVTSFSQTSSTVTITWDKGSAANMSNEAVYLDANFPTSVEIPSYYPYNADFPTIEALTGSFSRIPDFGTCAAGWNNYSSATSTGNISTLSTAYNADSNSAVRIDTLPAGTLLYLVLSSYDKHTCG